MLLGMLDVSFLSGKEPELECKMEQYQLEIRGLTYVHNTESGAKLLVRIRSLSCSGGTWWLWVHSRVSIVLW